MLCCKNSRIRLTSYGRGSSPGFRLALLLAESGSTNAGSGGGRQTSYKYWEDSVALLFRACCLLLRRRSRAGEQRGAIIGRPRLTHFFWFLKVDKDQTRKI